MLCDLGLNADAETVFEVVVTLISDDRELNSYEEQKLDSREIVVVKYILLLRLEGTSTEVDRLPRP